ncbi:MAG: UPF0175 family protein [Cyanobacteria bacterium P01_D01_bin.156]
MVMDTNSQTKPLAVSFTLDVVNISDQLQAKALAKAREAYVMVLLADGEISSGKAASLLGMSRLDMLNHMEAWGISIFDDSLSADALQQQVEQASNP